MQRRHAIGFAVFCLLSGSEWMVENAAPSALAPLVQQGFHSLVIGLIACAWLLFRKRRSTSVRIPMLPLAAASVLLLGLPAVLNDYAHTEAVRDGVGLFALVPLCIVVGGAAFGAAQGRSFMLPSLIGFAGGLLLLPFQLPFTYREGLLFSVVFAAVVLTAAGSLWMHSLLQGGEILPAVVVACGANVLLLGYFALLNHASLPSVSDLSLEVLRCVVLDLPQVVLLVWLLREMEPVRFASRFLLVPLLSVLEGVFLLRPPIDWRLGLAVVLIPVSGGILLLAKGSDESEAASSLGLR